MATSTASDTAAASRAERRRDAAKRQIMQALNDDNNNDANANTTTSSNTTGNNNATAAAAAQWLVTSLQGGGSIDAEQVKLVIQDLQDRVGQQQQLLESEAQRGKQQQMASFSINMLKLSKATKKMTVRQFNDMHNCNLLDIVRSINGSNGSAADVAAMGGGKKRIRSDDTTTTAADGATTTTTTATTTIKNRPPISTATLETPAPYNATVRGKPIATPSRTVVRGEAIFSKNGSPVDTVEEGTLVATVAKKRRGADNNSSHGAASSGTAAAAVFDINVGEGRYINLTEPGTVECLDGDMKDAAISQLKILQDQMASLMAQLEHK